REAGAHLTEESEVVRFVAGRDRGVGGEDDPIAHPLPSLVEGTPLHHLLADQLDPREDGVPLVEMKDIRSDLQLAEEAHAPHPEEDLLGHAIVHAAAVETTGDPA